jgi:hypothetical protein
VTDRYLEGAAGPRGDILHGERALGLGRRANRALDRPRRVGRAGAEQRLVQVEVRLHEAGDDEPASSGDLRRGGLGETRRDAANPPAGDVDVAEAGALGQARLRA